MAKKSADDLDAELAALEAELAALGNKKAAPKEEKKLKLPSFGRKKAEEPAPKAPAPAPTPAPATPDTEGNGP